MGSVCFYSRAEKIRKKKGEQIGHNFETTGSRESPIFVGYMHADSVSLSG